MAPAPKRDYDSSRSKAAAPIPPGKYTNTKIPRRLTFEVTRGMTNIIIAGRGPLPQNNAVIPGDTS